MFGFGEGVISWHAGCRASWPAIRWRPQRRRGWRRPADLFAGPPWVRATPLATPTEALAVVRECHAAGAPVVECAAAPRRGVALISNLPVLVSGPCGRTDGAGDRLPLSRGCAGPGAGPGLRVCFDTTGWVGGGTGVGTWLGPTGNRGGALLDALRRIPGLP